MNPIVKGFFDHDTWTVTYVVYEKPGSPCAIIDSVLDYDPKSGRTSTAAADEVIAFVHANNLQVAWILETHAHADHLTAAPYLKEKLGGRTAIGANIRIVQEVFKGIFNLESSFATDGSQFDHLFAEGETFQIGQLAGEVMYLPGHVGKSASGKCCRTSDKVVAEINSDAVCAPAKTVCASACRSTAEDTSGRLSQISARAAGKG